MSIWKIPLEISNIEKIALGTMMEHLDIQIVEVGDNFIKGRMPVDSRTRQPAGLMHGGASCVLAETLGSLAARHCVEPKQEVVGIEINTSHIKSIKEGFVIGTAKPLHLGKTTQVWEISIHNEQEALISVTRLRIAILT